MPVESNYNAYLQVCLQYQAVQECMGYFLKHGFGCVDPVKFRDAYLKTKEKPVSRKLVSTRTEPMNPGRAYALEQIRTIEQIQAAHELSKIPSGYGSADPHLHSQTFLQHLNLEWQEDNLYVKKGTQVEYNGHPCTVIGPLRVIHQGDW